MKKIAAIFAFFLTIPFAFAQDVDPQTQTCVENPGSGYCVELRDSLSGTQSVRGENGVDLIGNFVGVLYKYIASVIGIIAVLILVISGIQMVMGGVSSEAYEDAKGRVLQALLSIVLLFSSALILKTINPGFFT